MSASARHGVCAQELEDAAFPDVAISRTASDASDCERRTSIYILHITCAQTKYSLPTSVSQVAW